MFVGSGGQWSCVWKYKGVFVVLRGGFLGGGKGGVCLPTKVEECL